MANGITRYSLHPEVVQLIFGQLLSFRSTVQLVCQATKQLVVLTGKRLTHALLALLKAMASTAIGLQKRKNQPRAIKRRPKPFPLLTVPRHEACLSL